MDIMPGTTLKDIDETDCETLFGYFFWYANRTENNGNKANNGDIVYRDGKPYKKVSGNADWVKNIF